jgi:hypothetical protein
MPSTTEQFPVYVIVGESSEGRYLFTAEMSKE